MSSARPFEPAAQAELISRCHAGEAPAIGELYDMTVSQVYRFAFRLTGNVQDAEDLTSETYERALRSLGKYTSRDVPIIVWLLRIARYVAYERERASRRNESVPLTAEIAESLPAEQGAEEARQFVFDLLPTIPFAQREVIAMRLAGFKLREIAAALGKAEGTVKALQFQALASLRKAARK
jgi:RNA polymerase sigma-70 factor (ECF subfamily)